MKRFASRGYTFIELLVTLGITGLLAGLGTAGYHEVRQRADSGVCLNRIRQLGHAMLLYTQENGGQFPKTMHSGYSWAEAIAPYLDVPAQEAPEAYARLTPFSCPQKAREEGGPEKCGWSYAMNVFFELTSERRYTPAGLPIMSRDRYTGSPRTWHRVVNVEQPARTILLAENRSTAAGADHLMAHQWSVEATAINTVASTLHDGRPHFVFVDGHVEALPPQETFSPANGRDLWNPMLAK